MRTACSVASAVSRPSGSAGQTLCASSMTTSTGARSARCSQSRASTASADERLLLARLPASRGRRRGSARSGRSPPAAIEPSLPRDQTSHSSTPRFWALATRRRPLLRPAKSPASGDDRRLPLVQGADERAVLLTVGDGVEPQHGRLRRGVELREGAAAAALAARADADDVLHRRRSARRALRRRRRARFRGGRSRSWDRGRRCGGRSRAGAAPGRARASTSCRSRTGRRGTCAGRSRPRRARRGRRTRARSPPTASAARGGRVRSSQASTSSGSAGRGARVVERRAVAVEHDPLTLGVAQQHVRVDREVVRERDRQIGALAARRLERDHLAEPRLAWPSPSSTT